MTEQETISAAMRLLGSRKSEAKATAARKTADSRRGKKLSEETRAKMAEAQKKRRQAEKGTETK